MLEEISRKSSIKQAKEQAENTQRHYIQAEAKAHVQAETVRKVNQKSADMAMDVSNCLDLPIDNNNGGSGSKSDDNKSI